MSNTISFGDLDESEDTYSGRITDTVDWLQKRYPDVVEKLIQQDSDIAWVINDSHKLGLADEASLRARAKFMHEAMASAAPLIEQTIKTAIKRNKYAETWSVVASSASILFSSATCVVLLHFVNIHAAAWTAGGTVIASLAALFARTGVRVKTRKGTIPVPKALDKMIGLKFDLGLCRTDLDELHSRNDAGKALDKCLSRASTICKSIDNWASSFGVYERQARAVETSSQAVSLAGEDFRALDSSDRTGAHSGIQKKKPSSNRGP